MKLCDRIPDPEDQPDRRTRRRGIDNFEAFMKFLAPAGRGHGRRHRARRRGALRRGRLRRRATCHRCRRARARTRCSIARSCRSSRTCCCTTSGPATASGRRRPTPQEFRTPALWGCGCGGRCCTTARRPRSKTPSPCTAARPGPRVNGPPRLPADQRAALLAFLKSLEFRLQTSDFRRQTSNCSTRSFDAARAPIVIGARPAAQHHRVGRSVARFDLDRLPGLQVVALDEAQKRRILIGDARDLQRRAERRRSAGCRGAAS